ncbi:prolyl 3-hydroxylase OGFOD1 [Lepisosteus oculatus]|uniref:Prolyl 3-hydroxylase OGFOD1 n=1 Tax=Lepisosteus oculatus TaxID=7918 RepID=W5MMU6_LEPOC|nr:PREDICTED: prolyl 3-hydroxylase OGFOD1 [Lepisosteus oculatus]
MSSKRRQQDDETQDRDKKKKKERREASAELFKLIEDAEVKDRTREAWSKKECFSHGGQIELDCQPFPHCVIRNFLQSQSFLEGLRQELLDLSFQEKSNDLYKFKQSGDLKKRNDAHIASLRSALFQQFRSWLSDVLQVELEATVDISCAQYEYTDVLLCHDDELEGRRVAFILYLVPPWDSSDGGTLDLYGTDRNYQPEQIVKSLVPSWNTLVLFEVSPVSFHQVSEVLSQGKGRLSVSGWFHGRSLDRPPRQLEPALARSPHRPRDEALLYEWINPVYLDMAYQAQVQEEFEDTSEILLKNFLKEEKFKMVNDALRETDIEWVRRGPPNKRCYRLAEEAVLPSCVSQCWELLSSEPFFLLLSNFTGLKLHFLASGSEEDEEDGARDEGQPAGAERELHPEGSREEPGVPGVPVCRGELQRWSHGDYTLIHDTDLENSEFALDLLLHCGCEDWQPEFGGFTSYIASEEDEELLTIFPENNSLGLVYRDKETLRFVKHINHRSLGEPPRSPHAQSFYRFSFVYYE